MKVTQEGAPPLVVACNGKLGNFLQIRIYVLGSLSFANPNIRCRVSLGDFSGWIAPDLTPSFSMTMSLDNVGFL